MGIGIAACASHRRKTKGGCLTRQDLLNLGWVAKLGVPRYTEWTSSSDQSTFSPKKRVGGPVSRGCFSLGLVTYSRRWP